MTPVEESMEGNEDLVKKNSKDKWLKLKLKYKINDLNRTANLSTKVAESDTKNSSGE